MAQYSFAETAYNIFELNTQPRLVYLQEISKTQLIGPKALHTHPDITEIFFVESGGNQCTIDNRSYAIENGDIVFINTNVLHSFFDQECDDFSACLIGICGLHLKGLENGQLLDKKICPVIKSRSREPLLRQYFNLLRSLAPESKERTAAEAANNIMKSLLIVSYELIRNSKMPLGGQEYNLGLRIKEFIDEHYLEDLKLAAIAEALHVNAYYLSHTFKKILGYSPIQYMIHRRIGEAQNLLINTNLTVTEIALRCGYNNSNYFQVVFNGIVGMPPGKYRKAWRQ
jgi:AraC-like DNA-binding protein